MKKILVILFFGLLVQSSFSQVTYFNYLDYTSCWNLSGSAIFPYTVWYQTTYFKGDTTFNGKTYYKKYSLTHRITYGGPTPIHDTISSGPEYIYETPSGYFFQYNSIGQYDAILLNNPDITNSTLGTVYTFPQGQSCNITYIDTFWLGIRPLRRITGSNPSQFPGILEGVGGIGAICGTLPMGGGSGLSCYSKQGDTIHFNGSNCSSFLPAPLNSSLGIKYKEEILRIFPNPGNGIFDVTISRLEMNGHLILTNTLGIKVYEIPVSQNNFRIDLSSLESGIYVLHFSSEKRNVSKLLMKQ